MTAHTVISRLGVTDTQTVLPAITGSRISEINFVDGYDRLGFGLGQALDQLSELGLIPGERAIDLALLAATVTAADTRISRELASQDAWTREIEVCVPVSDPEVWTGTIPLLRTTLDFLTGDKWKLQFRARPEGMSKLVPEATTLRIAAPDGVCLFSGGLDSFIGATDLFAAGATPLLISHYWDGITSQHQRMCADALKKRFPSAAFHHVRAHVGFPKDTVDDSVEDTLRGRSFMFFALAALGADAIGGDITVHVPENGLISLNVPLDPLRVGALSTRTTHPFYMARVNDLFATLGLHCLLSNSYRFQTKGAMVGGCADTDFIAAHAKVTMSCSSPGKTRFAKDESLRQPKHCGYCVPCIIRRAALLEGCGTDATAYQLSDLHGRSVRTDLAEGSHIRSFQLAIARLRSKPQRARLDIHRPGPLTDHADDLDRYRDVYVDGLEEVARLLEGVQAEPL
ncbi:hypothetical protein QCE49_31720 [Caballeronia sp. LZ008]|uniref:Qat anti-phage system QueC-like protein QatC n=1 Tax=Caballeronia sp. LZ008 TaxID=3038560 RepID=UPI00285EB3E0|nr:Qat anti-phage system QueC-like protein QatC [Caballeronia sp. LZ008]MDR5797976.1 hypothetical protein [Caballeronia sp. LZ008]